MADELKPADRQELQHIKDGGQFCIDGRKEKRFIRLGWIENNPLAFGFKTTAAGDFELSRTPTPSTDGGA